MEYLELATWAEREHLRQLDEMAERYVTEDTLISKDNEDDEDDYES